MGLLGYWILMRPCRHTSNSKPFKTITKERTLMLSLFSGTRWMSPMRMKQLLRALQMILMLITMKFTMKLLTQQVLMMVMMIL